MECKYQERLPLLVFITFCSLSCLSGQDGSSSNTIVVPAPGFRKSPYSYVLVKLPVLYRQQALDVCEKAYGGKLIKLNSQAEENVVKQLMAKYDFPEHFWTGLQWTEGKSPDRRKLVWDDGQCSSINSSFHNFKDSASEGYDRDKQCFFVTDPNDPTWEYEACDTQQTFICQHAQVLFQGIKATFHFIPMRNSNATTCQSLCIKLIGCFMTSITESGCVVGLASNQENTFVFEGGSVTVINDESKFSAYKNSVGSDPTDCQVSGAGILIDDSDLTDYKLFGSQASLEAKPCPPPSTSLLVSSVLIRETVTSVSFEIVPTTTTKISEVHTCTDTPETETVTQTLTVSAENIMATTTVISIQPTTTTIEKTIAYTTQELLATTVTATKSVIVERCSQLPRYSYTSFYINITEVEEQITRELTVEISTLSKTVRALTSAENKKFSSVVVGGSVSIAFIIILLVVFLSDIPKIIFDIKNKMCVSFRHRALSRSTRSTDQEEERTLE